jgi:hypothetical protein
MSTDMFLVVARDELSSAVGRVCGGIARSEGSVGPTPVTANRGGRWRPGGDALGCREGRQHNG